MPTARPADPLGPWHSPWSGVSGSPLPGSCSPRACVFLHQQLDVSLSFLGANTTGSVLSSNYASASESSSQNCWCPRELTLRMLISLCTRLILPKLTWQHLHKVHVLAGKWTHRLLLTGAIGRTQSHGQHTETFKIMVDIMPLQSRALWNLISHPSPAKGLLSASGGAEDRRWVAAVVGRSGHHSEWHLFIQGLTSSRVKVFVSSYFWPGRHSSKMCPASLTVSTQEPPFNFTKLPSILPQGPVGDTIAPACLFHFTFPLHLASSQQRCSLQR